MNPEHRAIRPNYPLVGTPYRGAARRTVCVVRIVQAYPFVNIPSHEGIVTTAQSSARRLLLLGAVAYASTPALPAQADVPVLRANSRALIIRDGRSVVVGQVEPDARPDVYRVTYPRTTSTVTYVSDIDSITFSVKPGESKDFVILLEGKIACPNRISAVAAFNTPRVLSGDTSAVQVIPFTLRDNRIYVRGTINGSAPLLMQFDLGASGSVINETSTARIPMTFDARDVLVNSDGTHGTRASSANVLTIGNLQWSRERFAQTRNMSSWEDVIIGNSLFRDFVVEIDYNKRALLLHRERPPIPSTFVKLEMAMDNGVRPLVQAELRVKNEVFTDWYLFDTGQSGTLIIGNQQNHRHDLRRKTGAWFGIGGRKLTRVRGFRLAGMELPPTMATIETLSKAEGGLRYSLLGNGWLKHFNVVIDNQHGHLYLARIVTDTTTADR